MSLLQKPNQKSITNAGITAVSFVAGAKIGDGIAAVMPESVASYKKIGIGVVSILLAASMNAKTPATQAAQSALIGMGAKQLLDEVTETLTTAVAVKDNSTVVNKFVNAVVGHAGTIPVAALSAAWDAGLPADDLWERPMALLNEPVAFEAASMV